VVGQDCAFEYLIDLTEFDASNNSDYQNSIWCSGDAAPPADARAAVTAGRKPFESYHFD